MKRFWSLPIGTAFFEDDSIYRCIKVSRFYACYDNILDRNDPFLFFPPWRKVLISSLPSPQP